MEEETKEHRIYRIEIGDTITVETKKIDWKGKKLTFYKAIINMMNDGKQQEYKKYLMFEKGTQIEDGTKIKIKDMFEICRHKKNDIFTDEFGLFIKDYDVISGNVSKAVEEYKEAIEENAEENDMIF